MTLREACREGAARLRKAGVPEAELDAWYLLEWASGVSRSHYLAYPEEKTGGRAGETLFRRTCEAGEENSSAVYHRRAGVYGPVFPGK